MTLTPRQKALIMLAKDPVVSHVLAYGGARSGKTAGILDLLIYRALRFPGSRHLVARLRFNHAKVSIWLDSLPKALAARGYPGAEHQANHSDYFLRFPNGSEIWVDGLDSEERIEKILGREYATIYLNEISQISYEAATIARTRLSQSIPNMKNYMLYDCNPPSIRHWAYSLWFLGVDPESGAPLVNPEAYAAIRMNPVDNQINLPPGFIEKELATLPERKRRRFLEGEWLSDIEGQIFTDWDEVGPDQVPAGRESFGMDFGFTIDPATVVRAVLHGDDLYFQELFYQTNVSNFMLGEAIKSIEGGILTRKAIRADSAEPKSISELQKMGLIVVPALKGPDSVRAGIDWIKSKRLHIVKPSPNLKAELYEYRYLTSRDGKVFPVPVDDFNHAIDAARYACEDWIAGRHAGTVKIGAA